ncbi:MAG: ABC transporter ATP-binding protein, partial [Tabrizicola sp.]|nr:ABC transporter ATP-binding protein [Tabrizicola sp.]
MIKKFALGAMAALVLAAGCTTTDPYSGERTPNRTANAAIIGAIGGAAAGTLAGGDDRRNAAVGAAVGAIAGAGVGAYMDAQERKLREQMQIELKKLQQDSGIAFVVVTHDQEEALTLADRIALLDHGRIVQLDTPRALYDRPASRFAADFIGLMNFIPGEARQGAFEARGIGTVPAPAGSGNLLAIRPERVRLSDRGETGALAGQVEGAAFLGQDVIAHVIVPGLDRPVI